MHEEKYQKFLGQNLYPRQLKNYTFAEDTASAVYLQQNGQRLINFSANDYLGLANHPLLISRSQEAVKKWGVGSTSSRLVTGNLPLYQSLETQLASALKKPAALILGAGYQANISVLEALLDPSVLGEEPLIFCDRYCHVSLLSMSRHLGRLLRFRHNDLAHLKQLLEKYQHSSQPKFILAESLYSMDGDKADLKNLTTLAKKHQAFLYVDDAHAVGVYGEQGFGLAQEYASDIDIIMGTFSKGLGSFGAYIACSVTLREFLINKCRGLIYSTGTSPAVLGAMQGALEILPQLNAERNKIQQHAKKLRAFFSARQLNCGSSESHIIPWIIGDAEKTLRISQYLEELDILAATIRPPSVPVGMSRIRFCLSAAHSDDDIDCLLKALSQAAARF